MRGTAKSDLSDDAVLSTWRPVVEVDAREIGKLRRGMLGE